MTRMGERRGITQPIFTLGASLQEDPLGQPRRWRRTAPEERRRLGF
jgi:hypothetical protein